MDIADELTVLWDGQLIGRVRLTEKSFDPAKRFGTYEQPARWWLNGSFTPAPLFAEYQPAFDECNRLAREYDEGPDSGGEMARSEEAMRAALLSLVAHVRIPELDGKLNQIVIGDGAAAIVFVPALPLPIPSHLAGWVADPSFKDEVLEAAVRCPCGCDRMAFHFLGATHLSRGDGKPIPCSAKIAEEWFFIIKAVCTACGAERVLFDSHFHGCNGFLNPENEGAKLPRPQLRAWQCLSCGSAVHSGRVSVTQDYQDRYVKYGYAETFGADRWPDAFGSFGMGIQCCGCGLESEAWVSYEAR